jgi:putative ABC transport system ATP-binding protein
MSATLALDAVVKEYPGGVAALQGVSIEIAGGDQVAVVGPSGSGKTTLLTVLGTLERPSRGDVRVAGVDVTTASDRRLAGLRAHQIGFVFQSFHLQEWMTAVDNVANGMLYTGARSRDQRVAIARALAKRPAIILADEPTGNLDSTSGAEVVALLHDLAADGATLVLITHDPTIAATFDRRVQMRDGEIVSDERR